VALEAIIGAVVAFIGGLGSIGYILDRRVQRQSDIWRGIAEARQQEAHDCAERLDRVEAELEVMRSAWVTGAANAITTGVVGLLTAEIRRMREEEHHGGR
jgi:phage-related minor tail protein